MLEKQRGRRQFSTSFGIVADNYLIFVIPFNVSGCINYKFNNCK